MGWISSLGEASAVRLLRPDDDRSAFSSGHVDLDRFFREFAGQNQFRHHLGATYVAIEKATILGYLTVSAASIEIDDLPSSAARRLPRYPLPVLRIARMAVASSARGRGLGRTLLRAAFTLAMDMAERVGCVGLVVDAKPESVGFYAGFGFITVDVLEGQLEQRPEPVAMFLPLASIRQS